MEIKEEHKVLLKDMGLKEEDFKRFDGEFLRYEYNEKKGVRIYDPHYSTSYNEYIGIDGWSAWSEEKDTFMSNILEKGKTSVRQRAPDRPEPDQEKITEDLQKKFGADCEESS